MAFEQLTEREKRIVLRCLVAICDGPFVDDWDFQTRLGISRSELGEVVASWPRLDDTDPESDTNLAINNCLNEVLYGVRITAAQWSQWIGELMDEVEHTYERWARLQGRTSTGIQ